MSERFCACISTANSKTKLRKKTESTDAAELVRSACSERARGSKEKRAGYVALWVACFTPILRWALTIFFFSFFLTFFFSLFDFYSPPFLLSLHLASFLSSFSPPLPLPLPPCPLIRRFSCSTSSPQTPLHTLPSLYPYRPTFTNPCFPRSKQDEIDRQQ